MTQKSSAEANYRDHLCVLWIIIAVYAFARVTQLYAVRLPVLLVVVLHVVPPAIFAAVHGTLILGRRGMLIFAAICLGIASTAELISLRTGVPFGRYHFTDVMGPKIFGLPILLALAYLGIGYCAWMISTIILAGERKRLDGGNIIKVPLLAALIMTSWDLAMDPDWSTIDRVWIWHDGGPFFGVPISNFFGWFGTACVYYFLFALFSRGNPEADPDPSKMALSMPPILYAICALGNPLIRWLPIAPPVVTDASGKQWITSDILNTCTVLSLLLMASFPAIALLRLQAKAIVDSAARDSHLENRVTTRVDAASTPKND